MDISKDSSEQNLSMGSDLQSSLVQMTVKASSSFLTNDEMLSEQEKSDDQAISPKNTMEGLCNSFIEKYSNSELTFDPNMIVNEFNAKLRRVYDMLNILEGAGVIQKIEKGTYRWKPNYMNVFVQFNSNPTDWCSLRSLSNGLRQYFNSLRKGLSCNELFILLTNERTNKFNPKTIRRRIYECCKIFLIVGLIQKAGKWFYNSQIPGKDVQLLIIQRTKQKKGKEKKQQFNQSNEIMKNQESQSDKIEQKSQEFSKIKKESYEVKEALYTDDRKQMIKKIVNQFKSEYDLQKFIQQLNYEFMFKKAETSFRPFENKQEEHLSFFQHMNSQIEGNEEKQISPPIHKNIIIHSSSEMRYPELSSQDSKIFCSYPVNPICPGLGMFKNVKGS